MRTTSRFWADWTARDFAQAHAHGRSAQLIAVLPVAAIEQHGPHLPLAVDQALVDGVIAAALPHLDAHVPTLIRLWTDIGESVAAAGVRKLVLLNSHGGQVGLLDVVARDLRARLGMLVYSVNWFGLPLVGPNGEDVNALFSAHEHRFGIHAGEIETSMMLALAPERVDMALAQNFASTSEDRSKAYPILGNGKSAKLGWQMQDYNAAGAVGNAAAASAEKGRAVLDAAGRSLAQMLAELHQLPLETLVQQS